MSGPLASRGLRGLTQARVGLAQTGHSLATREALGFAQAHAHARDAIYANLSLPTLAAELQTRGHEAVVLHSAAPDRATYLRRPDLGRRLSEESRAQLAQRFCSSAEDGPALAVVLADGLSALAVDRHAVPLLDGLLPLLEGWQTGPILIAQQARVALGDEVGALLSAEAALVLIGERPGLSSPDSLGAYLTWAPRPGRTDAERNCVSNIRQEGLDYTEAARRIAFYLREARRLGATGVLLKEGSSPALEQPSEA